MDPQQVEQATRQWVEKAVIGLNLCPFAKSVYLKGQVRFCVSTARHLDAFLEDLDRELAYLAEVDPAQTDTTLLIHPTLFPDFATFNDLLEITDGMLDEHGLSGVLQIAHFHPDFCFDGAGPDDIANYSNRSPYPTLHLIREASIARAVAAMPDTDAIYQHNIALLERMGHAGWEALGLGKTAV